MTWIDNRQHPRKRDWSFYMCDMCFQNFWGPNTVRASNSHMCAGCISAPDLHFVGNPFSGTMPTSDGDCDGLADWGSYYDIARRYLEDGVDR